MKYLLGACCTAGRLLNKDHLLMRLNRRTLLVWQTRRQCTVWRKGRANPVQSPQGVRTECKLPGGEVIDEWDLYRRDHPQPTR